MEALINEVRQGVRSLRRRGTTTALAAMTLGLGIGASTAMFSVLNTVLLRPRPYPDAASIVSVYSRNPHFVGHPTMGAAAERGAFSHPEFRALRDSSEGVLDGIALLSMRGAIVRGAGEPERVLLGVTTADLFSRVLRVPPVLGRVFDDDDARARADAVVLTAPYWQRRFGADADVLGAILRLDDGMAEVIGVVPEEAGIAGMDVDAWILRREDANWGSHGPRAIARLSAGVTPAAAGSHLSASLAGALPPGHDRHGVNVFPRQTDETRSVSGPVWLLAAASLVLLAVACGNVAVLLVGSAIEREQEYAIRTALGAGRLRLIRQQLTESLLLGCGAAVIGVLSAHAATRGLVLLAPSSVPRIGEVSLDRMALGFGVTIAVACSVVVGLLPAARLSVAGRSALRTARSSTGRSRLQGALVTSELALATVLMVAAGLLTRTLLALNAVDPGFATESILALRVAAPASIVAAGTDSEPTRRTAWPALLDEVARELGALPGVLGVALTSNLPLSPDRANNNVYLEGYDDAVLAERRFVAPGYFEVVGIRIVAGRAFVPEEDRPDAPGVVIISEGLARRAYPDGSAVGRRLRYTTDREAVIVGIANDTRDEDLKQETRFAYYVPLGQVGQPSGGAFVIRTSVEPGSLAGAVRQGVRRVHESLVVTAVHPLSDFVSDQVAHERYRARLITVFAVLAALFSLMGIYAVTARSVAARTREIGIRMALGAGPRAVLGLVVSQAVLLGVAGAAAGLVISLGATRALEAHLWGVARTDFVTLATIALIFVIGSSLAALVPARRATRVDPQVALRAD